MYSRKPLIWGRSLHWEYLPDLLDRLLSAGLKQNIKSTGTPSKDVCPPYQTNEHFFCFYMHNFLTFIVCNTPNVHLVTKIVTNYYYCHINRFRISLLTDLRNIILFMNASSVTGIMQLLQNWTLEYKTRPNISNGWCKTSLYKIMNYFIHLDIDF
ncbi:hypothetical protein C0J52_25825 [Blattella germanica]|nr:hypothetical protein C0J52_25825 [Blattella germanica]